MTEAVIAAGEDVRAPRLGRWWQLTLGIICMSMIANLQYGWTLFVNPIDDKHHWGLPAIQLAFSIFVERCHVRMMNLSFRGRTSPKITCSM